ncbi:unnamed protein product [Symbiodinium sp. KB8]|nr:unnamed protein product [Symbiodinium sp. KB8]
MAEAESKVGTVEQELWNIFTFYSLNGNPLDPGHIRQTQFVRFARDVGMVGEDATSEALTPLVDANIEVAYTAQVNRKSRKGPKRMNYHDFLTTIMKLASRVYPHATSVDEAFQTLLMRNILPHAWRRQVQDMDDILLDPDVMKLYAYFGDALEQIFQFYGTSQVGAAAGRTPTKAGTPGTASTRGPGTTTLSSVSRSAMGVNTMKSALGYPEFLKFAADFDLSNTVILSTRELGDIYLSALKLTEHEPTVRKLSFDEFWEALVRCSLRAYSKISHSTPLDRIRGLFLYMWRAITRSVPRAFSDRRNVTTYAGDLLSGAMLFNKRFTAMWAEDGYRDYLTPAPIKEESGFDVLARLTSADAAGSQALLEATSTARAAPAEGVEAAPHGAHPASPPSAVPPGVRVNADGYPVPATPGPESPVVPRFGGSPAGAGGAVGAPAPPRGPRPADAAAAPKSLSASDFYKAGTPGL